MQKYLSAHTQCALYSQLFFCDWTCHSIQSGVWFLFFVNTWSLISYANSKKPACWLRFLSFIARRTWQFGRMRLFCVVGRSLQLCVVHGKAGSNLFSTKIELPNQTLQLWPINLCAARIQKSPEGPKGIRLKVGFFIYKSLIWACHWMGSLCVRSASILFSLFLFLLIMSLFPHIIAFNTKSCSVFYWI